MILVTPDPGIVGADAELVVPESIPPGLVRRLDLLEAVAELAHAYLSNPHDTDAAGWLAELLAEAGYPLLEEAGP